MICFAKYEGAGNDFLLIDDRSLKFPVDHQEKIRRLCDRKRGVGADGIVLLQPNFRMRIFNSDGSEAESCGNGLRCLLVFMRDYLGIVQERYEIAIGARSVTGWFQQEGMPTIDMGEVVDVRESLATEHGIVHFANTGVPHLTSFVDCVQSVDLQSIGPSLRSHQVVGKAGANVSVVSLAESGWRVRTYERGVEAETLACGTGAVAAAFWIQKLHDASPKTDLLFPGGRLSIERYGTHWWMTGPVESLFFGTVNLV